MVNYTVHIFLNIMFFFEKVWLFQNKILPLQDEKHNCLFSIHN